MNVMNKDVVVTRPYKVVYREGDQIIKVFTPEHGKANVFNEALCQARVEESGLNIPKVLEVTQIDGEWALKIEYVEGKTMEEIMIRSIWKNTWSSLWIFSLPCMQKKLRV